MAAFLPSWSKSVRVGSQSACASHLCGVRRSACVGDGSVGRRRSTIVRAAVDGEESAAELTKSAEERMLKSVESTKANFNTIRTGRANAGILDRVVVNYYDTDCAINTLASISASSATTLTIDPYDKSAIAAIERALMEADIGLTPNSDGNVIRLTIPQLTQERRKELAKQVKGLAEEGRVAIRNIRRDGVDKVKKLEKDGDLGKDQSKSVQGDIQKLTDKYIKMIDGATSDKEKDILTV